MTAIAGAGLGLQLLGGIQQSYAAKQASEYNASVAQNQAAAAMIEARYKARRLRDRSRRIQAAGIAAVGASGITMEGSPTFVLQDNSIESAMDELAVLRSGEARARGLTMESSMLRSSGRSQLWGGLLSTVGSTFNGASRMDWGEGDSGE